METVPAKTIVTRAKSDRWFGMDYNMNIYRGCCHGCIYCDSRSACYGIENFDTVRVKENALAIIRDDLRRKVKTGVISTGAMSDPYNPFESKELLTRHALELVNAFGFGIAIATKSVLVARDIDILKDIAGHSPVLIKVTITAAKDDLTRILEPNAPSSTERFRVIKQLSENGIYCGILLMPILPYITDTAENISEILRLATDSGARFVHPAPGVTLRDNQREYFYGQLDSRFPGLKKKYIERFRNSYYCGSPNAKALMTLINRECTRLGLLFDMQDIIRSYKLSYESLQLRLF